MTPEIQPLPEIKGFNRNTLLDWEGMIASIIFLPGCNFRCPYCHASALVLDPASQPTVPLTEVDAYLQANRGWVDGLIITGGEPTINPGLPALADHFIELGMQIKLFTNGTNPDMMESLVESGRLAAIAMDVKCPLDERYERAAHVPVDVAAIRRSAGIVMNSGLEYEFRTTVCPEVLSFDDVVETAGCIEGAQRLVLQQFRQVDCLDPAFEKLKPYPRELLEKMAEAAGIHVRQCVVSG